MNTAMIRELIVCDGCGDEIDGVYIQVEILTDTTASLGIIAAPESVEGFPSDDPLKTNLTRHYHEGECAAENVPQGTSVAESE